MIQVFITRQGKHQIDHWNIYNAPVGATDLGEGLRLLLTLIVQLDILAGDFNIHHTHGTRQLEGNHRMRTLCLNGQFHGDCR